MIDSIAILSPAHKLRARNFGTAGVIMDRNGGVAPGFDALRLFLAIIIAIYHCYRIDAAEETPNILVAPIMYTALGLFFALSGFLVTGSAKRTGRLQTFLCFRALRIVPALAVEVFLSAIVIGPLVTLLPLGAYFLHPEFFAYFGNIVGHVTFTLPGVFVREGASQGFVNMSLWTLKPEFVCYLIMATVIATSSLTQKRMLYLSAASTICVLVPSLFELYEPLNGHMRWHLLVYSFVLGSLCYTYKDRLVISGIACFACFTLAVAILQIGLIADAKLVPLAVPPLVYVTVCLGMWRLPLPKLLEGGDYSYGVYLYGWPIAMTLKWFFPWASNPFLLTPVALLLTILFAVGSWHCVEKRALGLRKRLFGRNRVVVHA